MKRKRGWLFYPLIIVALLLCTFPAYADTPTLPHAFYGTLTISGSPAAVGTVVKAKVGGVECGSITTTVAGQYGGSGAFDAKLLVSGEIETGATIYFYANNSVAGQTYAFSAGAVTELNLTVIPTDTTPPSVSITALSPDPTNDNTPTFTGTATDTESNISSVEYKVDSGSWTAASASDGAFDSTSEGYTFTTAALSDGAHTVYVRATDAIGNTTLEANYASDSFTVDTTPPSVTITALSPDPTNDNTPTFTGTATDTLSNISSVEYKVDAGSWTAASASDGAFNSTSEGYTFTTAVLSNGAHTVYVRATDSVANTTAEVNYASDNFTVDTIAPTVVSTSPANGATGVAVNTTVSVTFSEAMKASTITTGSFTLVADSTSVSGSVSYSSGTYTATFTPSANLPNNKTCTATLSTAITDAAGNPLAVAYSWSFTTTSAPVGVTVSIDAPEEVAPGDDFTAKVNISQVTDFDACNYDVSFDTSVLRLDDVTSGVTGSATIPVDFYNQISPGTYGVVQNVPGLPGVSGSGYLAVLHFHVIGSTNSSSPISLSSGVLSNIEAQLILATWVGDSVSVVAPVTTTPSPVVSPPPEASAPSAPAPQPPEATVPSAPAPQPPEATAPSTPAQPIKWPVLWGVIGVAVAVGVTAFLRVRKRKAY